MDRHWDWRWTKRVLLLIFFLASFILNPLLDWYSPMTFARRLEAGSYLIQIPFFQSQIFRENEPLKIVWVGASSMRDYLSIEWMNHGLSERFPQTHPQATVLFFESFRPSSVYLALRELLYRRRVDYIFISNDLLYQSPEPWGRFPRGDGHLLDLINDEDILQDLSVDERMPFFLSYALNGPRKLYSHLFGDFGDKLTKLPAARENLREVGAHSGHQNRRVDLAVKSPMTALWRLPDAEISNGLIHDAADPRLREAVSFTSSTDLHFLRRIRELSVRTATKIIFVATPQIEEAKVENSQLKVLGSAKNLELDPLLMIATEELFPSENGRSERWKYFRDYRHLRPAGRDIFMQHLLPVMFATVQSTYQPLDGSPLKAEDRDD